MTGFPHPSALTPPSGSLPVVSRVNAFVFPAFIESELDAAHLAYW
jgi:hypothetical protein